MGIHLELNPRVSHAWQGGQTLSYLETVSPTGGVPVGNVSLLGWNDAITVQATPPDTPLVFGSSSSLTFGITSIMGPQYSAFTRDLALNATIQPAGNIGTAVDRLAGIRSTLNLSVQAGQPANNSVGSAAAIIAKANSTGAAGANIAEVAGVRIDTPTIVGPGLPATLYGLSVKAIAGGTANYAIQTATGLVDFGDNVTSSGTVLALNLFEDASGNLALGSSSLNRATPGTTNTVMGVNSLAANTTGNSNCGFGANVLNKNTTGFNNSVFGQNALFKNTTGYQNTGIGVESLYSCTTGNQNVGVGVQALDANTTGWNNSAVGQRAFFDLNIIANDGSGANTGIGFNTGRGIVTGVNNTIVGANVTGLAAGLTSNIILANGSGTIKAQHDGTNWTMTGNVYSGAAVTSALWDAIVGINGVTPGLVMNSTGGGGRKFSFGVNTTDLLIRDETGSATRFSISAAGSANFQGNSVSMGTLSASSGSFSNPVKITGAISSGQANTLVMANNGSGQSQLWALGPDASTTGSFNFIIARLDLTGSTEALKISNTGIITLNNAITTGVFTVANLPAGVTGMRAFVTNALTGNFRDAVVGGGAFNVPVYFDSLVWRVG